MDCLPAHARSLAIATLALAALAACGDDAAPDAALDGGMDASRPRDGGVDASDRIDAGNRDGSVADATPGCGDPCDTGDRCALGVVDCAGGDPACVASGPVAAGTVCRPSMGGCDLEETCDGSSMQCPADGFVAAASECRASTGPCDPAETCSGRSPECPADAFEPSFTPCTGGTCDGLGTCLTCGMIGVPCAAPMPCAMGVTGCVDGSPVCVVDGPRPAGAVCRAQVSPCDVEEVCDGTTLSCPADGFAPEGTTCTGGTCDGTGTCAPSDAGVP